MHKFKTFTQQVLSSLKSNIYLLFLLVILGILVYKNYTPGTWLTGWDNLHPEFNFGLNIKRAFHSAWQEYQGLGLLAGMAHAADLFREIFLWIVSIVIPVHFIRYFYHFVMIASGTVGVYFFIKDIILPTQRSRHTYNLVSITGALFYLLNLGTIQYIYVPFEPYSTYWGLFPWELYTLFSFLKQPSRKHLILFILVNILALGQAYVQTVFLVYVIVVGLILAVFILSLRNKRALILAGTIVLSIFLVNAFWILPQAYFVATDVHVTQNAMQNQMATEKFYQMNKRRGTIRDFMVLKEFYYDFLDSENGETIYMMQTWRDWYEKPYILVLGYTFFALIILGILQKNPHRKYVTPLFLLSAFLFLSETPVIEQLNNGARNIPLFNQVFRNPFTKAIVPTSFIFSVGFALGLLFLIEKLPKKTYKYSLLIAAISAVLWYGYPAFTGQLISPRMRVKIPQEYFDLFAFMQTQDTNKRIMNLPQGGYWGWYSYSWGLRGSGFIWYGIEQPIMDRAFDVWSDELEGYYWELSTALRKNDQKQLNEIIEKYHIGYVLYDESLIHSDPFNPTKLAYKQQDLLEENKKLTLVKKFDNVSLYKTALTYASKSNVLLSDDLPNVHYPEQFSSTDVAFSEVGLYKTYQDQPYNVIYPFGSLFTNRSPKEAPFAITEQAASYTISTPLSPGIYDLTIPPFADSDTTTLIPVHIFAHKQAGRIRVIFQTNLPILWFENEKIDSSLMQKEIFFEAGGPIQEAVLSINNKDSFDLNSLTASETFIGSTYLYSGDQENTVNLYSVDHASSVPLVPAHFSEPHICGTVHGDVILRSKKHLHSLELETQNTALCQVYSQSLNFIEPALIEVRFQYKSYSDEYPAYCFYSDFNKTCLNGKDSTHYGFSNESLRDYVDRFEFYPNERDTIYPQLILEALRDEDTNQVKKITYEQIRFISYPLLESHTIDFNAFLQRPGKKAIVEVNTPVVLRVEIPKMKGAFSYADSLNNNVYKKTPLNYDSFTGDTYDLEENIVDGTKQLQLTAQQGSSYFLAQARKLPMEYGYILFIDGQNKKGLPLSVNIFSMEGNRNVTYTTFHPTDQEMAYVLPPGYPFDEGLSVLLGTTSYTNNPSINEIYDIDAYPLPYSFLSKIKLKEQTQNRGPYEHQAPEQVQKATYFKYKVQADNFSNIVLFQAYHPGWHAYGTNNWFTQQLPFIFGKKLNHFEVNNWANGWILGSNVQRPTSITIIFWPQYLQYLGFIFLLLLPLIILKQRKKVPAHNQ